MRRMSRTVLGAAAAMLMLSATASGAAAAETAWEKPDGPDSVVIDGREFGPEDGLVVEVEQFEVTPGGGPVGEIFVDNAGGIAPMATWGSSYAISTETAQLRYTGKAKAAANIYSGKRIIEVCFWYSRGTQNVSSPRCSNAKVSGSTWYAGPEVSGSVWDSLDPNAPRTIFNISTYRIDPQIF